MSVLLSVDGNPDTVDKLAAYLAQFANADVEGVLDLPNDEIQRVVAALLYGVQIPDPKGVKSEPLSDGADQPQTNS